MANYKDVLLAWTKQTEIDLINNYHLKNIKASGNFERKITDVVTENRSTISAPLYIGGAINGRRPNTNSSPEAIRKWVGWAGSTIIKQWCEDKGIDIAASYAIAYKIAERGWSIPNTHGNDGKLITDTVNQKTLSELNKAIGRLNALQIKSEVQKAWQL